MTATTTNDPTLRFTLDGRDVSARAGETIIEAAKRHGVDIPHLCYMPGMRPDGNCRACMVEVKGERVLAAACCRRPTEGMEVSSASIRARNAQQMVLELLCADMPDRAYRLDSELDQWAKRLGVGSPRFMPRQQPSADESHHGISVRLDACIQCTRCVRACREEQVNDVIGYAYRAAHAKIVFDFDDAMGASTCVGCGECVQACPTGALMPAGDVGLEVAGAFTRSAPTAASAVSSRITSRTTASSTSKAATDRRTTAGCA
jgi:formate dehydrogenase major subunit